MSEFQTRNSQSAEEYAHDQAQARMAARRDPAPVYGNVGQGPRGSVDSTFSAANLGDFTFYQAHREEILEAAKAGTLPGQANYTTTPNDNN